MVTEEKLLASPMGQALVELSNLVEENLRTPITLNVIGGFALMLYELRDINSLTDIDYIGDPLSLKFKELSDYVGKKHSFGPGWINNDVMLAGISLTSFKFATGPLHFNDAFTIGKIKIRVLDKEDLVKMKLIAIDTNLTAIAQGGDFTRKKDFKDILALLSDLNLTISEAREVYENYMINPNTMSIIRAYEKGGLKAVRDKIDDILHGKTTTLKLANPSEHGNNYHDYVMSASSRYKHQIDEEKE